MEIEIFNINGINTGRSILLNHSIFGATPNEHIVYLEIKRFLASQRQGSHKSKERGDISGSTRKLQRQKGTGNARKGSINSPLLRGGARVFGPRPRKYNFKLNKHVKKISKCSILSYKLKNNYLKIIEDFSLDIPKTKYLISILKSLNLFYKKTIIITEKLNKSLYLSSRNLNFIKVITINELNSYILLKYNYVVFLESSINLINKELKMKNKHVN